MDNNPSFSSNHLESGAATSETSSAKVVIGEVAQGAPQVAGDLATRARKAAEDQLSEVQQLAADRISSVADALRATGDQLRSKDGDLVSGYVDQAVDKLDAASGYLQSSNFSTLISDVEDFARREPAIVFGGALLLGIIGGRFLKASGGTISGGGFSGGAGGSGEKTPGGNPYSKSSNIYQGKRRNTGGTGARSGGFQGGGKVTGGGAQSSSGVESERAYRGSDFASDNNVQDREPVRAFEDQTDDDPSNSGVV